MILILPSINDEAALEAFYNKILYFAKMSFFIDELLFLLNEGVHIIDKENKHHLAIRLCHQEIKIK